ncbi:MAG: GNAT family N-acetyltransferase [Thermomicrobiales bacterium]
MNKATIREYRVGDEAGVVRVWNAALWADPIGTATWRAKVLLDPNFDAEGCFVAEADGEVRGFLLSLVRRAPFFNQGLEPEASWITAFGVEPGWQRRGVGGALLDAAVERLRGLGRMTVAISPYVPNYFTPGVDLNAYANGVDFLSKRGFEVVSRPLSMRAELTGFRTPAVIQATADRLLADGVEVRLATHADIVPVLDFAQAHFSWDWRREATGVFADLFVGDPRLVGMLVATRGDEVIGYAQHRAERFGPFGVRPDQRGRGVGRVLLAATLTEMLRKHFHAAWFLWTSDAAARLYAQCGFHEVRRFAVMTKALGVRA